jgi:DNA-binding NarL/FixJ family response regulator
MSFRCVIVDDQTMFLQFLAGMVRTIPRLELVGTFSRTEPARGYFGKHSADLLILDLALPDGQGLTVLKAAVEKNPKVKCIVLSGHASQFVCPADLRSHVRAVVDKTQAYGTLQKEIAEIVQPKAESSPSTNPEEKLTGREYEIFSLVGQGRMSKEIGEKLGIAVRTVETHRKAICRKLKMSGPELVRQASLHLQTRLPV